MGVVLLGLAAFVAYAFRDQLNVSSSALRFVMRIFADLFSRVYSDEMDTALLHCSFKNIYGALFFNRDILIELVVLFFALGVVGSCGRLAGAKWDEDTRYES